jgi:probable selenium-dependent hydroxylase accessory protein YqeC
VKKKSSRSSGKANPILSSNEVPFVFRALCISTPFRSQFRRGRWKNDPHSEIDGRVLRTRTGSLHYNDKDPPPDPSEGLVVISSDNLQLLRVMVERVARMAPNRPYKLVVTRHFISPNLLRGVPPDFYTGLDRELFPILLNEADGAASYSIKLPRDGEPVLMEGARYLVPVVGLDCLNQPLGPKVVFRFQLFAEDFSLRAGESISPELASAILMHKQGVCKNWTAGTILIPFINKVDTPDQDAAARHLADSILHNGNFPVKRVVFGSVLQGRIDAVFD